GRHQSRDHPHGDDLGIGAGIILSRGLQPRSFPPPRSHADPRALQRLRRPGPLREDKALIAATIASTSSGAGLEPLPVWQPQPPPAFAMVAGGSGISGGGSGRVAAAWYART